MNEIKNTAKLVKDVLENSITARNSDSYLYYKVCLLKLKEQGISIYDVTLSDALLQRKQLNLPCFKTVERARRKVQKQHPELAGSERVTAFRAEKEEVFREYAREG